MYRTEDKLYHLFYTIIQALPTTNDTVNPDPSKYFLEMHVLLNLGKLTQPTSDTLLYSQTTVLTPTFSMYNT